MWDRRRQSLIVVFLASVLTNTVIASPIYVPQFLPGSTGRNIRHLPCVSRRTGETGVCMFAFTCAKANGTHLGTCIDRFYFGSCCKIDEDPYVFPPDNNIDVGPTSRPFVSTDGPIESNDIPEYVSRPRPNNENKPPGTDSSEATTNSYGTSNTHAFVTTFKETTKIVTKKPIATTVQTTTQPIRLSTFQSVQNDSKEDSTTKNSLKDITTTAGTLEKLSTITESTIITKKPFRPTTLITHRPPTLANVTKTSSHPQTSAQTTKPITKRPTYTATSSTPSHSTTYKPTLLTTRKPTQPSHRPTEPTTSKTVFTTTQKTVPITRFPPRNTTSVKPLTQAATKRPLTTTRRPSTSTKRPALTTKKPNLPTKRPITTSKPSTIPNIASTSAFTTTRPIPTTIKPRPTVLTTTESTLFSTEAKPSTLTIENTNSVTQTITTTKRPDQKTTTTKRPDQKTTTPKRPDQKVTTARPTTFKTTTPRPPSTTVRTKPTKISTTTTKTVSKPEYHTTTERTRPFSSTESSTVTIARPEPTLGSTKPLNVPTNKPSTTTSTASSLATSPTTLHSEPPLDTTTSKYVVTTKVPTVNQTLEEVPQTTYSPGIVTWTSSSDNVITKAPEFTSTTTQKDQTDSDWTPITTPDGWIMIQSPSTEKSTSSSEELTTKPIIEPTLQPLTSAKPITETTIEDVTKDATIQTTSSSTDTVTADTELPVSMETLNMTDYKQICGRRLFPESRIVGGSPSSFGKWPWQISLQQWRTSTYLHKCGAALLNENWAITAAHCVENVPPSDLLLRVGEHDLANEDEPYGYQERRVQIVASHPQFDPRTFEYDLALLRFYEPLLPFQPNIVPICLPDNDETYVGRTAYVTGWGRLYDEGPLPFTLQEVPVPVINNTMCEAMFKRAGHNEHIPHIFICAGYQKGGYDSCEGDSGGPMAIQRARDKRWILAGVISWGISCAASNQPGVYTRISEFREWINQILQF